MNQVLEAKCEHCHHLHRIELEETDCTLCGKHDAEVLFTRTDLAAGLPGEFTVVQCRSCGLIYLNPRPTQSSIDFYYPSTYGAYTTPKLNRQPFTDWITSYNLNKRCRLVYRHHKDGRLLDVGCATGDFLNQMRLYGDWDLAGVELVPEVARVAQDAYGLDVTIGTLGEPNTAFSAQSFDVITLWDVVEHVYDPIVTLTEAARIVKPNGHIIFSIPILDSLGGRVFGKYWLGYDVPRHLHFFTRDTLGKIVDKSGLTIVEESVVYGSDLAVSDSARFWLRAKGYPKVVYTLIYKVLRSPIVRLPVAPIFKVLDLLHLTSMITVTCKLSPEQKAL